MFKICAISPDKLVVEDLERILSSAKNVALAPGFIGYPSPVDFDRFFYTHKPDAVLLSNDIENAAMDLLVHIRRTYSHLQVGVLCADRNSSTLIPLMRAGARDVLFVPLDPSDVKEVVGRLRTMSAGSGSMPKLGEVFCFVPSKPGVGTSTIALNTAVALAAKGSRVLLIDGDLTGGMVRFMLKIENQLCLREAVKRVSDLDNEVWPMLVTKVRDGLDVLHAGRVSDLNVLDSGALLTLLDFWRRNYDAICFDFSGALEHFSIDVMRGATKTFLVSTSELTSLHLLKEKNQSLKIRGVERNLHVIHNRRTQNEELSKAELEKVIGLPVFRAFPNSYSEVLQASREGRPVRPTSPLGIEFAKFAGELRGDQKEPEPKSSGIKGMLAALTDKRARPATASSGR